MFQACSRIFLLLNVSLISFIVEAEEELVLRYDPSGSNSWVPYYIQGAENPGILGEYVPRLLAEAGIAGKKVVLPAARMQLALEKGEIDFDNFFVVFDHPNSCDEEEDSSTPLAEISFKVVAS